MVEQEKKFKINSQALDHATFIIERYWTEPLIETLRLSHGALDVEGSDILPVLLQQRHQEVNREMNVVDQLILSHPNMAHRHSQTQHLSTSHPEQHCSHQRIHKRHTRTHLSHQRVVYWDIRHSYFSYDLHPGH